MILERISMLLNRQATGSPRARDLLSQLAGRSLRVEVRPGVMDLDLRSDGIALRLARTADGEPSARISGTPLALLRLAGANAEQAIRDGAVQISGDAEIAGRFRELLRLLRPELEEELARVIGPAPASTIGALVGGAAGWLRNAGDTAWRNVGEYLAHEHGDLVSQAEGRGFLGGVDSLRERTDRLAARIAQLEAAGSPKRP